MAKNKTSKSAGKTSQDETVMSEESLEQIVGGVNSGGGQDKGKGKGKKNPTTGTPHTGGITTSFGDGSVRTITDGTSNTISFGE